MAMDAKFSQFPMINIKNVRHIEDERTKTQSHFDIKLCIFSVLFRIWFASEATVFLY